MGESCQFLITTIIGLLTPLAIIGVGIWVNTAIRKKGRRDSVLVDHLRELQKEISQLIRKSIDTEDFSDCTACLRRLANDIQHLTDLRQDLMENSSSNQQVLDETLNLYIQLKKHLTNSGTVTEDNEYARLCGNNLRMKILKLIVSTCDLSYSWK